MCFLRDSGIPMATCKELHKFLFCMPAKTIAKILSQVSLKKVFQMEKVLLVSGREIVTLEALSKVRNLDRENM